MTPNCELCGCKVPIGKGACPRCGVSTAPDDDIDLKVDFELDDEAERTALSSGDFGYGDDDEAEPLPRRRREVYDAPSMEFVRQVPEPEGRSGKSMALVAGMAFLGGVVCALCFGAGAGTILAVQYLHPVVPADAEVAVAPKPVRTPIAIAAAPVTVAVVASPVASVQVATPAPVATPVAVARVIATPVVIAATPAPTPRPIVVASTPAPVRAPVRAAPVRVAAAATPAPRPVRAAVAVAEPKDPLLDDDIAPMPKATPAPVAAAAASDLPWTDDAPAEPAPVKAAVAAPTLARVIHSQNGEKAVELHKNIAITGADGHTVVGKLADVSAGFVDIDANGGRIRIAEKDVLDAATY